MMKNALNLRTFEEHAEALRRRRTFILDTANKIMEISFFFSANIHQCNIAFSVLHVQIYMKSFLFIIIFHYYLYFIYIYYISKTFEDETHKTFKNIQPQHKEIECRPMMHPISSVGYSSAKSACYIITSVFESIFRSGHEF